MVSTFSVSDRSYSSSHNVDEQSRLLADVDRDYVRETMEEEQRRAEQREQLS